VTVSDVEIDERPVRRLHIWSQVGFAHLRAHRCGVILWPKLVGNEALCHEPPTHRAEMRPLPPFGAPVTALCARHAAEAEHWHTVVSLTPFRELADGDPLGEG
jgi:hypothetical protein